MPRDIDEKVTRNRYDPRAEPTSAPPPAATSEDAAERDSVSLRRGPLKSSFPPPRGSTPPTARASSRPVNELPTALPSEPQVPIARQAQDEAPSSSRVTSADPRLADLEPHVRAANWDAVLRALGPEETAGRLPPNLGLLYALARKEKEGADDKGSESTSLAMRCTAALLGVDAQSAIALVVAKRLIRKNPVAFRERPAPRASVTATIITVALVLGSAVGWLFATGRVRVLLRF